MVNNRFVCTAIVLGAMGVHAKAADGRFPVFFENLARGEYSDDSIFIYGLAVDAEKKWCRFLPDGSLRPIDPADARAPGHLTKNGVGYANYSFPISKAGAFRAPDYVRGGRIYVSLGSPLYFPIGDNAWGGPDLLNPADPNADVIFDWYEFTYVHGLVAYGGNTTQVDQFGFPMTARLRQDSIGYDETVGITLSREEVFSRYQATVGPAFRSLSGPYRIVAPRSASYFKPGGPGENHLRNSIEEAWTYYAGHPFNLTRNDVTFAGSISGNRLQFTRSPAAEDGAGPFFLDHPATFDVFACNGALARDGMKTTELELGAEVCAAFNRGVALNTANWYSPATYYPDTAANEFSRFFHSIGMEKRAYGFPYDDVNDQSSVKILPNADPPTSLTLYIGPIKKGALPVRSIRRPAKRSDGQAVYDVDGRISTGRSPKAVFGRKPAAR